VDHDRSLDEFTVLIDTGMKPVPRGEGYDVGSSERLQRRLAELDAVHLPRVSNTL